MLSREHHTAIFIVSMFMLFILKDLLTKFIITCTLKDKLTTWLSRERLPRKSPRFGQFQD
jgi:hypothetical protein